MDLRGIAKYAKEEKGVKPAELSDEELDRFTKYTGE